MESGCMMGTVSQSTRQDNEGAEDFSGCLYFLGMLSAEEREAYIACSALAANDQVKHQSCCGQRISFSPAW